MMLYHTLNLNVRLAAYGSFLRINHTSWFFLAQQKLERLLIRGQLYVTVLKSYIS